MNYRLITFAIILFILGQGMVWIQINGPLVWPWAKKYKLLLLLFGIPITQTCRAEVADTARTRLTRAVHSLERAPLVLHHPARHGRRTVAFLGVDGRVPQARGVGPTGVGHAWRRVDQRHVDRW